MLVFLRPDLCHANCLQPNQKLGGGRHSPGDRGVHEGSVGHGALPAFDGVLRARGTPEDVAPDQVPWWWLFA